ncbi:hypothetical protein Acr_00g0033260 [Actinidia rufa]|uniref:Uncharacterized protein n=1 Tax=Actinidia rufa TaxID=165716 RepID=A0A7J0DFU2_9ERIC|nr:hypothetical protein Acr_00g0033260 [Actinidia rufa]
MLVKCYQVYEPEKLSTDEALELFSRHAFGENKPIQGYKELSEMFVQHCEGLPLALQVLGSSVRRKSLDVWKSMLQKLQTLSDSKILEKLEISFDSLQDKHDKNVFLEIACFFVGKKKNDTITILDGCEYYTLAGIHNLLDRNLLTIENGKLRMHHLIQDMGKQIVFRESDYPQERSRIWRHKESFNILNEKDGTKKIEGLTFDLNVLKKDEFETAHRFGFSYEHPELRNSKVVDIETNAFENMFFSPEYMPNGFPMDKLVALDMRYSNLKQVWSGAKSYGGNRGAEEDEVIATKEKYTNVIGRITKFSLVHLSLAHCNLTDDAFPGDLSMLSKLQHFCLVGNPISTLPNCVKDLKGLQTLDLSWCPKLREILWPSIVIEELVVVTECRKLEKITFETSASIKHISHGACMSLDYVECGYKILPVAKVDVELLNNIGFFNLDLMANVEAFIVNRIVWSRKKCPIQILYEYIVFSTYFPGREVPHWFSNKNAGSTLTFTITSSPRPCIQGVNLCLGDEVEILFGLNVDGQIKECGVHLLYVEEEEEIFQYYKTIYCSWDSNMFGDVSVADCGQDQEEEEEEEEERQQEEEGEIWINRKVKRPGNRFAYSTTKEATKSLPLNNLLMDDVDGDSFSGTSLMMKMGQLIQKSPFCLWVGSSNQEANSKENTAGQANNIPPESQSLEYLAAKTTEIFQRICIEAFCFDRNRISIAYMKFRMVSETVWLTPKPNHFTLFILIIFQYDLFHNKSHILWPNSSAKTSGTAPISIGEEQTRRPPYLNPKLSVTYHTFHILSKIATFEPFRASVLFKIYSDLSFENTKVFVLKRRFQSTKNSLNPTIHAPSRAVTIAASEIHSPHAQPRKTTREAHAPRAHVLHAPRARRHCRVSATSLPHQHHVSAPATSLPRQQSATSAVPATSALVGMAQPEVSQPISIVLDESNYRLWSSAMQRFLRARKLWKYITGSVQPPHFSETDDDEDDDLHAQFQSHLEDWDSVNSKIITWFSNTSVSSIHHSLFTPFETAKEVWNYLAERYSSVDGANEYQLGLELHHLRFDPDRSRLRHFLMALPPDYEHIRASLLHRHPLPTVGQALAELRSEETRKKTMVYQHSQPVLATPVWAPPPPSSSQPVRVPSSKNIPSGSQKKYCGFCRRDTHSYEDCRYRPRSKRKGYHNRQTAAVTDSSGPSPDSSSSTLTAADVETIVTQVLSRTNIHSSALSTTSGSGRGKNHWDRP